MWLFMAGLELCQILISVQVTMQKYSTKAGGKTKELLDCQAHIKLAVTLRSKQTPSGPAREQSIR